MGATLLTLGVLLILLGLIGQVKAKEIEVGTKNPLVRIILGSIGVVFVSVAMYFLLPSEMAPPPQTTSISGPPPAATREPPTNTPPATSTTPAPTTSAPSTDTTPARPRAQTGPIALSVNNDPRVVPAGGATTISVFATAGDGTPVSEAQITISAGGGIFEATGATKVVGRTDAQGVFRTKWRAYEASTYTGDMSYVLGFEAAKEGMTAARTELTVPVRK